MTTSAPSLAIALAAVLAGGAASASAQTYPAKPLRIIVPFPPGAATDMTGRFVAAKLGDALGQQAIVDNRPGAGGTLGLGLAAKAPPDGHTLVIGHTGSLAITPSLTKVGYDPLRDFSPVTMLLSSPHVVAVHPSLPVRSLKDLVALAKSRPGQMNYASTGSGSAGHLGVELLKKAVKMDVVHVPYKGGAQGMTDLVAGHVVMMFTSVMSTQSFARTGKVRMLAVAAAQRSPSAPEVPTIAESGVPNVEVTSWWGMLVPAAVPKDIVARLNSETVRIIGSQDARDRLGAMGADLKTTTPEQFSAFIRSEHAAWGRLIRETGARVD